MESHYRLNLNKNQFRGPFEKSSPVLDVIYNSELVLQLGLNIGHVKSSEVYFQNLVGNHPLTQRSFFDYNVLGSLFDYFYSIMHSDPSVSTFTWNKLNTYQFSFSDKNLEYALLSENRLCRTRKIKRMLGKSSYKPSSFLIRHLNKNPADYSIVLSMIYDSNEDLREKSDFIVSTNELRENFHRNLLKIIEGFENRNLNMERESLKTIEKALESFKGMLPAEVSLMKKFNNRLKGKLADEVSLTRNKQKLIAVYDKFLRDPGNYSGEEDFPWDLFSDIWKMPTTLHEKANRGYNPEIVSFQFKEPITKYKERKCLFVEVVEPEKKKA